MINHTWRLNEECQTPVSVLLKQEADGQLGAFLCMDNGEHIPIKYTKRLEENINDLGNTTARVKKIKDNSWKLYVNPLSQQNSSAIGLNSSGETIEHTIQCHKKALKYASKAIGKNLIGIIGNTGSGKTTLLNHLLGCCEMVQGRAHVYAPADKVWLPKSDRVMPKNPLDERAKIGHAPGLSHTLFAKVYEGDDIVLADCAGFQDSRGEEYIATGSLSTMYTLRGAAQARLLVCLSYGELESKKAQDFGFIVEQIIKNFVVRGHEQSILSQVVLVITKAPKGYAVKDAVGLIGEIVADIRGGISNDPYGLYYEEIIRDQGAFIRVYDPLDGGASCQSIRSLLVSKQDHKPASQPIIVNPDILFFIQEMNKVLSVMREIKDGVSALHASIETLKKEREYVVSSQERAGNFKDQNPVAGQKVSEKKRIENEIQSNQQKINDLSKRASQKQTVVTLESVKERIENKEELSIDELLKIDGELQKIGNQVIPGFVFNQAIQGDGKSGFTTVTNMRKYAVEIVKEGGPVLAMAVAIGVGVITLSPFAALAAAVGLVFSTAALAVFLDPTEEVKEVRPRKKTHTFSYTGIPFAKVVLDPPEENQRWFSRQEMVDVGRGMGQFNITYAIPDRGSFSASVKLQVKLGDTTEFRQLVDTVKNIREQKQKEIERLEEKNKELRSELNRVQERIKVFATSVENKTYLLQKQLREIEGSIADKKEKEAEKIEEIRKIQSDILFVEKLIEICEVSPTQFNVDDFRLIANELLSFIAEATPSEDNV